MFAAASWRIASPYSPTACRTCASVGAVQVHVQRRHAPLDVDVLDDQRVAVLLDQRRREALELLEQLRGEALARQRDVLVFEGVGHAPDAIVEFHQQVLLLDLPAIGVLRRRDHVLDHLEDVGIGRQREHQHHQAADAGRDDEVVAGVPQVVQEVAVEKRLAVLLQAEHRVDLGGRLVAAAGCAGTRRRRTALPGRP